MATETLILRPTAFYILNSSNIIRYPDTTPDDEVHLLISEEIPDDDATYYITQTKGLIHEGGIYFSVPSEYKVMTPVSIRVIVRTRSENGTDNAEINMPYKNPNSDSADYRAITLTDSYDSYVVEYETDISKLIWQYLIVDASNSEVNHHLIIEGVPQSGKGSSTVRVTQVYLEVDFEIEETSGIYVKKNNNFIQASKMFNKVNGSWVEITSDECKTLIQTANQGGAQ